MDLSEISPVQKSEKTSERKKKKAKNLSEVTSLPNEGELLFEEEKVQGKSVLYD